MIRYDTLSLTEYLEKLASREPVPGGGSVAALSGALGAGLIEMVTRYSLDKGKGAAVEVKLNVILTKTGLIRAKLLELVSLDSEAYLKMREAKKAKSSGYKTAVKAAAAVPRDIKAACTDVLRFVAFLRKHGNPYLLSDVTAAEAFLKAGVTAAQAMIETNQ